MPTPIISALTQRRKDAEMQRTESLEIADVKENEISNIIIGCAIEAQALTYLRLMNLKLALVINFGEQFVKDGIHRVVNRL